MPDSRPGYTAQRTPLGLISRRLVASVYDLAALAACWLAAYWLRFNLSLPDDYLGAALLSLGGLVPVYALLFWLSGLYRGIWRYASLMDLRRIILSVGLGGLITAVLVFMAGISGVPRSVLVLHPILLILTMGGGVSSTGPGRTAASTATLPCLVSRC